MQIIRAQMEKWEVKLESNQGKKNDIMDMYAKEFDAQHKLAQFRTSGQPLLVI